MKQMKKICRPKVSKYVFQQNIKQCKQLYNKKLSDSIYCLLKCHPVSHDGKRHQKRIRV